MSTKISVVIHTFNCENILRDCLERVKDFDEIVICDMYSDDKTLDIAKEYNAKIVMFERSGYAEPARNFAIQSASNDWVLVIDSDEWIKEPLQQKIREFVENPGEYTAARIGRRAVGKQEADRPYDLVLDKPEYIIRLFRKDVVDWPPEVHSTPVIKSGKIYNFPYTNEGCVLDHVSADMSYRDVIEKFNRYTDFEVEKLARKNKKINIYYTYFQSIWRTFEMFFKWGYKSGVDGFIWCVFMGFYKFLSRVKYYEYLKKPPETDSDKHS